MNHKKSLLVSMGFALALLSFGEATFAYDDYGTQGSISSPVTDPGSGSDFALDGDGLVETAFNGQSISGGNFSIPQDVVTAIIGSDPNIGLENNSGNFNDRTIVGTDIDVGDNSSSGGNSDNTITRRNSLPENNSIEAATGAEIAPDQIVICLTNSCSPGDSGNGNIISVNELAKLIENDLNQALTDLATAEQSDLNLANSNSEEPTDNSRNILRRQTSNDMDRIVRENCGCVPGERKIVREPLTPDNSKIGHNVKTVAEAREIVEIKLDESSKFIEQINQLKPENSLW
ncbi:MAG: hypothetical protein QNJ55_10060 [Xenococcus sp. MO_188.B8]|nr:hypothetical protein [Xenococcus sp. MO_188.B8]